MLAWAIFSTALAAVFLFALIGAAIDHRRLDNFSWSQASRIEELEKELAESRAKFDKAENAIAAAFGWVDADDEPQGGE